LECKQGDEVMKQLESLGEALSEGRIALENASNKGPWMAVILWQENGEIEHHRISWKFENSRIPDAVKAFQDSLAGLTGGVKEEKPLPEVDLEMPATVQMPALSQQPQPLEAPPAPVLPVQLPPQQPRPFNPAQAAVQIPPTPDGLGGDVRTDPRET
jgi:hypothetical protein